MDSSLLGIICQYTSFCKINLEYKIYCDGSANLKEKKGGIGILLITIDDEGNELSSKEISKGFNDVTNNQMELIAFTESLKLIEDKTILTTIITDSQYVEKGIIEWYDKWKLNGKDYKNKELWDELMIEYKQFSNINIIHTRGHGKGCDEHKSGNDIVDKLANYKNFKNETL